MRHGVKGSKLGRVTSHRKAMYRNQLAALFLHERICTTITKAKALRPQAERLVTIARREGSDQERLHARRLVEARIDHPQAAKRLFTTIAPRFRERPGGYIRILKLGKARKGDAAELAIIQFVDYEFVPKEERESAKGGGKDEKAEAAEPKAKAKKKEAAPKAEAEESKDEKPAKAAPKKKAAAKKPAKKATKKKDE